MTAATILIADDDASIRTVLSHALSRVGYEVRITGNITTLWHWVAEGEGDLVITDVMLPDGNGLDLLPKLHKLRPDLPVIVISAVTTLNTAMRANQEGAFDYLPKPFDLDILVETVQRALSGSGEESPPLISDDGEGLPLIGRSPAMQDIYRALARLMNTDLTVMILGESGTGKELVARALHDYGKRRTHPFVALNMAAIPRELIESELFGHEKGAFTGAVQRAAGRFEQAEGGTLFLDEIGDMPLEAQTRLLRVLQEGEYTAVGGQIRRKTDVRIVTATHRDIPAMIRAGTFREDLYYRLNVATLRLPPLRDRRDDIPVLAQHFLLKAQQEGLPAKRLSRPALDRLQAYAWPGNVRELENLMRRLAALCPDDIIGPARLDTELGALPSGGAEDVSADDGLEGKVFTHLQQYFAIHDDGLPPAGIYDRVLREVERPLIRLVLDATGGNQIRAAQVLGLNRNTLRKKIRELDIPLGSGSRIQKDKP